MSDKIEDTRGLQYCFWRTNGKLQTVPKGGCYRLYLKDQNEFVLDERCVGPKTTNPKHTIENARWAFIYDVFFQSLEKAKSGDITDNLWGPLSGGKVPVSKYALGTRYKVGKSILFNSTGESYYYGFKQRVELFSESPGTGFYFYIVPITKSKIDYAYFHKSEDVKRYGENVNLTIMFHGYNLDKKNKYKAKIYLLEENEAKGLTKTKDFEEKNLWDTVMVEDLLKIDSETNWNYYFRHNFNINVNWRKGENKEKKFTVVVEVYRVYTEPGLIYGTNEKEERVEFKNYADTPTTDLINYDTKLLKIEDVDKKDSISSRFIVSEELMDHYLSRVEVEKNNQIQYIGDIRYTRKEYDPCGYSKITIKDEEDKKRQPFIIFDESAAVIDNTASYFEVTAGEKAKLISITLDGLKNQDVYCQGLLLNDGQKHSDKANVFQIDRLIFSAIKGTKGYETEKDKSHEDQLRRANTAIDKENKEDYDVIKNPDNSKISTVQSILRWENGKDYNFKGENEIDINVKYTYNKSLTISNNEFDPNFIGTLFEDAWLFNYLLLNINQDKQSYYLPISTCRYPNQIAKINVLPDIKWTLLFKFNFKEEDFQKFKEEHNYQLQGFFVHASESTSNGTSSTHRSATAAGVRYSRTTTLVPVERKGGMKRLIEILKRIEVTLTAEWKDETGKKQEKDVIEGFLKQIYNFFSKISDISKLVGGLAEGDSNEEDKRNKKQLDNEVKKMLGGRSLDGAWDALNKKSQETEILYPSIAIAASWLYADADDPKQPQFMGRKALQIDAKVDASPIIGVEIKWEFLEMLARRHPLAFIIKKGVDLLLYLSDPGNKVEITFTLSGELGLTANFKHNMLAGNAYSNGHSPTKQELISGAATVKADLQGNITIYSSSYIIISEYKMGAQAKIGVKAEVSNKVYLGADIEGLYIANTTAFDGFTFYLEAEAKLEFTLFGVKMFDWNPKYEPEPLNWGKCSLDWMKVYLNNPNKKTDFLNFNTGDDE